MASEVEIKKIVKSGKGDVVFLTKQLKEIGSKDHVLVAVDSDKKGRFIRIRPFKIKE